MKVGCLLLLYLKGCSKTYSSSSKCFGRVAAVVIWFKDDQILLLVKTKRTSTTSLPPAKVVFFVEGL